MNVLLHNLQTLASSTAQLVRNPGGTLMTVSAMGITLALPALLYVFIDNLETLGGHWEGGAQVNLFLEPGTEPEQELMASIGARPEVARIVVLEPSQALEDFKAQSGFERAIAMLDTNPLPWTLIVHTEPAFSKPEQIMAFVEFVGGQPSVHHVRSDVQWLRRLNAFVAIAERLVWIVAFLLGVAAVVIISNTIRLAVLSRRDEIEVVKLVGGTDRFIRRPFLYQGTLQGLMGAVAAIVLVTICVELLQEPTARLLDQYNTNYKTQGLRWETAGLLLGVGALLGWGASRWSVGRHIADIEPE